MLLIKLLKAPDTERPWASRLSDCAKVTVAGPIALSACGDIFEIVVRFMNVSVDSPLENLAERDVGNTWFGPPI